jgi:hypothetical protein
VRRPRVGIYFSAPSCLRACCAGAGCPDLFRLWSRLACAICCRFVAGWFERRDVLNQAISLLVHFCHEPGILLLPGRLCAWFTVCASARLRFLAALDGIGECLAGIELFVVALELLTFARRSFVLPGFVRGALRAALPTCVT